MVFPRFANCFCQLGTVGVNVALLVVKVALIITSAAKISFSVVSALVNELKYPSSSSTDSCGSASGASGSGTLSKSPMGPKVILSDFGGLIDFIVHVRLLINCFPSCPRLVGAREVFPNFIRLQETVGVHHCVRR